MTTFRLLIAAVFSGLALLAALATPAMASDNHRMQDVRLRDNCDPVTFNAALGNGACAPVGGQVTLQQLLAQLAAHPAQVLRERNALGWRFNPDHVGVKPGTTFHVTNQGGELHTFTNVTADNFTTGGCIDLLNGLLGLRPNSLCVDANGNNIAPQGGPALVDFLLSHHLNPVFAGTSLDVPVGTPNSQGQVLYQCLIHPWMRMSVTVESGR